MNWKQKFAGPRTCIKVRVKKCCRPNCRSAHSSSYYQDREIVVRTEKYFENGRYLDADICMPVDTTRQDGKRALCGMPNNTTEDYANMKWRLYDNRVQ